MTLSIRSLLVGAALAAVPAVAHAQAAAVTRPVSIGISGGAALPQGDFADGFGTGFIVGGHVKFAPPTLPIGFRADVNYSRNSADSDLFDVNISTITGFANAVLTFAPATSTLRPYVLGGLGFGRASVGGDDIVDDFESRSPRGLRPLANRIPTGGTPRVLQIDEDDSESETGFAFQVGAGVEIPLSGITGFGEIGYQRISLDGGSLSLIPIRFGIRF